MFIERLRPHFDHEIHVFSREQPVWGAWHQVDWRELEKVDEGWARMEATLRQQRVPVLPMLVVLDENYNLKHAKQVAIMICSRGKDAAPPQFQAL